MEAQPPGGPFDRVPGAVRESFRELSDALVRALPHIATAVIVLVVFWGLATLARLVTRRATRFIDDPTVKMLASHVSYYLVWAIGVIVMLDALGMSLTTVATGLGLGGVALGFALKDILSNFVSGILILAMRPFEIGDQIVVGETEGTVERIELRATHIKTYDGRLVLVPSGELFSSRITNNTAAPVRQASVVVYLGYKADVARALSIILETVKSVPGVRDTPAPLMRLREFGPDSAQLEARFWADSTLANFLNTASAARVAILEALKTAGIKLPDPEQRVIVSPVESKNSAPGATGGVRKAV